MVLALWLMEVLLASESIECAFGSGLSSSKVFLHMLCVVALPFLHRSDLKFAAT